MARNNICLNFFADAHYCYLALVIRASATGDNALKSVRNLPTTVLISLGLLAATVNTGDNWM